MIYILPALMALLVLLDIWTTKRALRKRGNREANPLVAWLMGLGGNAWVYIKLAVSGIAIWLLWREHQWVLALLCTVYAFIVVRNFKRSKRSSA